jgi:mono/diheme cytochrome c family protein
MAVAAFALVSLLATAFAAEIIEPVPGLDLGMEPSAERGLQILLNEPMAATVLRESDIDELWKVWEPGLRDAAESMTPEQLRIATFERYGWAERIGEKKELPLGYNRDGNGGLVTNCFACHGGKVAGKTLPGAGNTHLDLTTLATDVRRLRVLESGGDPYSVPDVVAPFNTPLNQHKGVTNAVIFAFVFAGLRDSDRGMQYMQNPELLEHHDMNPPAWWLYKKKDKIYADSFAPKTPRQLMPFAMSPTFSEEKFHSFEPNFVHIQEFIQTLEAPKYPYEIDHELAEKGRVLFEENCSKCHGTYGENWTFPNKEVPWDEVQTDPVRLNTISAEIRESANNGWLQYNGEHPLDIESEGYIAQPLDGIWATAPYFHNGAVPTLYHVFNIDERPLVWKRDENGYDKEKVGLNVEVFDAVPEGLNSRERRMYYNTANRGNSAEGHTFPDDKLDADEKVAVIEYLKTL